jgi:hypothetical protein
MRGPGGILETVAPGGKHTAAPRDSGSQGPGLEDARLQAVQKGGAGGRVI